MGQSMAQCDVDVLGVIVGRERRPGAQRITYAVDAQHIALRDPVVVAGVLELGREDAEIRQVLPVNPGERFGDDCPQAQIRGTRRSGAPVVDRCR